MAGATGALWERVTKGYRKYRSCRLVQYLPLTLPRFARVPPSPRLRGEGRGEGRHRRTNLLGAPNNIRRPCRKEALPWPRPYLNQNFAGINIKNYSSGIIY